MFFPENMAKWLLKKHKLFCQFISKFLGYESTLLTLRSFSTNISSIKHPFFPYKVKMKIFLVKQNEISYQLTRIKS